MLCFFYVKKKPDQTMDFNLMSLTGQSLFEQFQSIEKGEHFLDLLSVKACILVLNLLFTVLILRSCCSIQEVQLNW